LDTAGQEEYTALREQWIRDGEAFALVYSITSRETFQRIHRFHRQVLKIKEPTAAATVAQRDLAHPARYHQQNPAPIMIIGNKADRVLEREVSTAEGYAFAKELGCKFVEMSAKNRINVEEAFYDLIRELRQRRGQAPSKLQVPVASHIPPITMASRNSSFGSISRFFHSSKTAIERHDQTDAAHQVALDRVLIEAAKLDDRRGLKKLLAKGADVNAQPGVDGSALHAAAALGHAKVLKMLLENGAAVNARGPREVTALQLASIEGHTSAVNLLLDCGAPVDATSGLHGTALLAAASRAKCDVARILIRRGADVNVKGGPYGNALQAGAVVGKPEMVKILLDSGASVNARGEGDCTALQVASFAGNVAIVQMLLRRGAEVNAAGGKYGFALKAANDFSHFDVFKALISFGASEDALKFPIPKDAE
jgi:ankyrin repeat protein